MSRPPERPRIAWWRLWAVQGSWNRQGMQNLGWWVAVAPWLRRQQPDARATADWLRRGNGYRNTNPYLVGLLLGAWMRVEEEGDPALGRRLADGLSRSLGSLGDAAVWTGIRPVVMLAVSLLGLLAHAATAVGGWLLFAIAQGWLRGRCLRLGYERGVGVVDLIDDPRIHRLIRGLGIVGVALAGALSVWLLAPVLSGPLPWGPLSGLVAILAGGLAVRKGVSAEWVVSIFFAAMWLGVRIWTLAAGRV